MPLIPVTRDELKQLKTQADEDKRMSGTEKTIKELYDTIVQFATKSTSTNIRFNVYENMDEHMQQPHSARRMGQPQQMAVVYIAEELIGDVVSGLRRLFPDSKIGYISIMARAPEEKIDSTGAPIISSSQSQKYKIIDVDWS